MTDLWTTLLPLIVGSAIPPIQIVITILLLRSSAGRITAVAWVAGMTATRVAQGVLFGLVLGFGSEAGGGSEGPGRIVSTLLLVFAVLLYVMAAKYLAGGPDEDAPPPRWMTMVASASPGRAFLLGAGILAIGPKFWVFTLGAIAAIESAGLGQPGATLTFVAFVILAASIHLAVVGLAYAVPSRSGPVLASAAELLQRYNRAIMIVFGVVFGSWFLLKALGGFGVL